MRTHAGGFHTGLIAVLVAATGCAPVLTVGPVGGVPQATVFSSGVYVTIPRATWDGDASVLPSNVWPVYVEIINDGPNEVRVALADFVLRDETGVHTARSPFVRAHAQLDLDRALTDGPKLASLWGTGLFYGRGGGGGGGHGGGGGGHFGGGGGFHSSGSSYHYSSSGAHYGTPAVGFHPLGGAPAGAYRGGAATTGAWSGAGGGHYALPNRVGGGGYYGAHPGGGGYGGGRGWGATGWGYGGWRGGRWVGGGWRAGAYGAYLGFWPLGIISDAYFTGLGYTAWSGPWGVNTEYWDPGFANNDQVLAQALPEGVLAPGGRVSGYIYFLATPSTNTTTFEWDLHNGRTGEPLGPVSVQLNLLRD